MPVLDGIDATRQIAATRWLAGPGKVPDWTLLAKSGVVCGRVGLSGWVVMVEV